MKLKNRRLIWLASFTLLTALIWTALDSYHQLVKKQQIGKVKSLIEPLDPHLSTDVLKSIEARKEYRINDVKIKPLMLSVTPGQVASKSGEEKK